MVYEIKKGERELYSYTQMGDSLDKLREELKRVCVGRKFEIVEMPLDTVIKKR